MNKILTVAANLVVLTVAAAASELSLEKLTSAEKRQVVVHEWGTFTSVANETGDSARWAALSGPADLPCFVARLGSGDYKDRAIGKVRMETPVLYFYSKAPVTLSVNVAFPEGWITEWYPNATRVTPASISGIPPEHYSNGEIRWDQVHVSPGASPKLPVSQAASHYFAARETDAAPIRVGSQWEKLIFYRGVADFSVPLRPVISPQGAVRITNAGPQPIPLAMLFENRAGKIGFRLITGLTTDAQMESPELTGSLAEIRSRLEAHLVEFGLYPKEAAAMVETWRDSWFEEGMRLFYIAPREMVDRVLPLQVQPAPSTTVRVFVGRIEILSPAMRRRIDSLAAANDLKGLQQIGRFLGPFTTQMERTDGSRQRPSAIQSVFDRTRPFGAAACVN
ncbi:MAG TPA: hypothetical protein VER03_08600 [Bryobacteraceae bacterium]|nr:hypothetical protein [Bryobacteraceae bacterium]